MAKETVFTYKIKVDGQEVTQSINTIDGFQSRLSDLYKQLNSTPINSKEWKQLQKEIKGTEGALSGAESKNKSFLQNLSSMPGILGQVGQSVQGVGQFFGNFSNILKASPIALIATLAVKLIQKLSQMEGVLDPLNKITAIFSGTMGRLASSVLTPITYVLEKVADGFAGLMNFLSGSADAGDALGYVADEMDKLEDSNAAFELSQQKSNRALQEARELAADSTKPVAERIKALQDAEKLERDIAKQAKERALAKARAQAIELAIETGQSADKIKMLKTANQQEVENFANSVTELKKVNREKLDALYGTVGQIEQISSEQAKIGKKTAAQIKAVEDQAAAEGKARAQEAANLAKQRRQDQISDIDAEVKLLTSFQEDNKVRDEAYYKDLENKLKDYYKKRNELEDKDKKLTKAQLENRRRDQEDAIKKGLQVQMDGVAKQQKLNEDLLASEKAVANAKKGIITDQILLVQQQQTDLEVAYERDKKRLEDDLKLKEQTYGKDSEQYKQAQIAKNTAEANFISKSNENNQKIEDGVKARNERLKNLEDVYEKEKIDGLANGLQKQIAIIKEGEEKKLKDYKKGLDDAVKNGDLTLQEASKKYEAFAIMVGEKTVKAVKLAVGDDFISSITQGIDDAISGATTGFFATFDLIDQAKTKLDEGLKAGTISLAQYQKGIVELNDKLNTQYDKMSFALDAVKQAVGAATQAFGEQSAAGRVLIKVSQGIALAETGIALAKSLAGLGEAIKKPFPANVAAVAGTLGLIATAFGQAKALFAKQVPENDSSTEPRKLASGGLVSGEGSSTSDSIPAMLSNGESVINARSTAMFTPLLSAINQAGGGRGFQFGGVVSSQDITSQEQNNSLISALSQQQESPIKTYVVAQDMTSMQMFDRAQKSRSTL